MSIYTLQWLGHNHGKATKSLTGPYFRIAVNVASGSLVNASKRGGCKAFMSCEEHVEVVRPSDERMLSEAMEQLEIVSR